jgi:hypothetical protein
MFLKGISEFKTVFFIDWFGDVKQYEICLFAIWKVVHNETVEEDSLKWIKRLENDMGWGREEGKESDWLEKPCVDIMLRSERRG